MLAWTPTLDWNSARIFPAFLFAGGISPYASEGDGPATGWIYGPVMPLLYLPATFAPTITMAMIISAIINLLMLVGPPAIIIKDAARRVGLGRGESMALLLIFFGFIPVFPVLINYLRCIMVDQVAIGLTLLSSWFLVRSIHEPNKGRLGWAAILAVLAVWTKQIAVIIPLAQLFYLGFFRRDRSRLLRYTVWLLGTGAAISVCMVLVFGLEPLVFNLWIVPGAHALKGWTAFANDVGIFVAQAVPCVVLTGVLATFVRKAPEQPAAGFLKDLIGLLLTIAAVEFPLNLLGANKVGGGLNSFHAVPLLFTAAMLTFIAAAGWWQARLFGPRLMLTASLSALVGLAFLLKEIPFRLSPMPDLEAGRIIAAQYRGQVYFPDNPLIVWWTERKIHHLEYGLVDQAVGGFSVTKKRYFEYLPEIPRVVIYPKGRTGLSLQIIPALRRIDLSETYDFYASPPQPPAN